jgi:hypothetical protein
MLATATNPSERGMVMGHRVHSDRERHVPCPNWFEKPNAAKPLNVCNGSIPERQLSRNEPSRRSLPGAAIDKPIGNPPLP